MLGFTIPVVFVFILGFSARARAAAKAVRYENNQ
jgi:hypothetical protein